MTLIQLLQSGGVLRYRPPYGFYVVKAGQTIQIATGEAKRAVNARQVLPAGIAGHGVYVFSMSQKAIDAMSTLRSDPKTLPARPAAAPNALPDLHPLRGQADPENPAPVPSASRAEAVAVQGGAGAVDDHGAQRAGNTQAGQGKCVGCGGCAGQDQGVK